MPSRTIKDADGRMWACRQDGLETSTLRMGQDVSILCTTATVHIPVRLTVGWQWTQMSENGLARKLTEASPVPKKQ